MGERRNLIKVFQELTEDLSAAVDSHAERYVSPVELRKIYRKLKTWCQQECQVFDRESTSTANRKVLYLFKSTIVYYLLERFYWIRYGDSEIVVDLLHQLYKIDGHLGKIFDYKILPLSGPKGKSRHTTWSYDVLSDAQILPFEYFLEHSNKKRALFGGQRLAERYFVHCIMKNGALINTLWLPPCSSNFRYPEVLIELLRYGLFANSATGYYDDINVGKLLTFIIGAILNSNQESSNPPLHTLRAIEAGNILLRAVPRINMESLLEKQSLRNRVRFIQQVVQKLSVPRYLPYLSLRCNGPQELKHISRCAIRHALYNNWQLPHGIFTLAIPTMLKQYLNLEND